ncbi:MAG: CvpA family protein [Bacteroidota bacterium]|uniref:CvpA family protein n=1 Tax=Parabacteroides sp. FAFU027 TaxID=2922715 RepID=UPI001FAFFEAD|nr:CvpA family protein [Parabacteroides sp. FAFU027]MDP4269609.1 CvpA family protein [Bacteroidota bacterium]
MNFIDWIIIILVGLGVAKGFLEGLVRQLVSLMGLVFGTWVAIHYADAAAVFLQKVHEFPEFVWKPLSFFLPFIVTLLVGNLIATIIQRILAGIGLGPLNQIAGAVFGGLKSALLLSILFNLLQLFDRNNRLIKSSTKEESFTYYPVVKVAPTIFPYLQKYFKYEKDSEQEA